MSRPRWLPALLYLCLFLPTLLALPAPLRAAPGDLTGYLTGPNNVPVTGARVTLSLEGGTEKRTQLSDAQGFIRFLKPPPGRYDLAVEADGYAPLTRTGIQVTAAAPTRLSLRLAPIRGGVGLVTELASPRLEPSVLSTTLRDSALSSLLKEPTTTGLLAFTPGYHDDVILPDFAAPVVRGPSFHGAGPAENRYRLDGLDITLPLTGAPAFHLPLEFLDQATVRTGGSSAVLGEASGGIVELASRFGGNRFHGDLFFYVTPYQKQSPEQLEPQPAGADPLGRLELPFVAGLAGLDLGGYLVPDRVWFFLGAAFQGSFGQIEQRIGENRTRLANARWQVPLIVRLTLNPTPDQTIQLSGYAAPGQRIGVLRDPTDISTGLNGEPSSLRGILEDQSAALSGRYALRLPQYRTRADLFVGAFGQRQWVEPYPGDAVSADPDALPPSVVQVGLSPVAGLECGETECVVADYRTGSLGEIHALTTLRLTGELTLSHRLRQLAGEHLVRWGGSLRLDDVTHQREYTGGGLRYQYGSGEQLYLEEQRYLTGSPAEAVSEIEGRISSLHPAAYLEDSWMPFRPLTVEVGVRVDGQHLFRDGSDALQLEAAVTPHLALTYSYHLGHQGGRLSAGYRRQATPLPLWLADAALLSPSTTRVAVDTTPPESTDTANTARLPAATPSSLYYAAANLEMAIQNEYAGGLTQSLGGQFVAAAHLVYRDLVKALDVLYYPDGLRILGAPGQAPGEVRNNLVLDACFTEENPLTGAPTRFCYQTPVRNYRALELRLDRVPKAGQRLWLSVAYTLSRLEGDYSGPVPQAPGQDPPILSSSHSPLNLDSEGLPARRSGPLPADRTHRVRFDGAVDLPLGLRVGLGVEARSGVPRDVVGLDPVQGDLVLLYPRGAAGRTPWLVDQAVSVGYQLRFRESRSLSLVATVFNPLQLETSVRNDPRYVSSLAEPMSEGVFDPAAPPELSCVDPTTSQPTACEYNTAFDQPLERQTPLSIRLMARYSF